LKMRKYWKRVHYKLEQQKKGRVVLTISAKREMKWL